jgi:hypothetical protein
VLLMWAMGGTRKMERERGNEKEANHTAWV